MKRTTFLAVAALLLGVVTSGEAQAESAPGCGPVTQIGKTAYIGSGGQKWASVKQFKGCGKNWAYIYTWDSVHGGGAPYTPEFVIIEKWGNEWSREPYGHAGRRDGGYRQQELWSSGTDTLNTCTSAYAEWNSGAMVYRASTEIRC
ncbi:hypothetical protein [Nocardia sp. NRRL S-836]|uniref:hypothetical protein n=1 Tax=Nocardia sp. NRRL S-836 TaxID=1519492 RepID=UPI0006AD9593|nr:hypothetical protein [Nocardia sp. NRRL S-836]KOV80080.1 hypothetical protein ADL03_34415 [Nocardia sp. NRRL S-836]